MALTNLAVFGGAFFTPILVGKITHTITWPWTFYFEAIFCGACLPLIIFFVPETAFRRSARFNIDMASSELVEHTSKNNEGAELPRSQDSSNGGAAFGQASKEASDQEPVHSGVDELGNASTPKVSYAETLMPFNGRKTDESFFKLFLRPFPLFAHPAILWACLIQGTLIGWTVFIGIILAAIFLGPPLFWSEVETGYAYTGAFIGAILGFLVAGGMADWSAKFMTRHNGGIYEPEFRILLVIPQLVFGCAGLYGFGVTSSQIINYHWIWPVFFFALEVMGMVVSKTLISEYQPCTDLDARSVL